MRRRAIIMLTLATVVGALAVFLTRVWLENQSRAITVAGDENPVAQVVVARTALSFGNELRREHLRVVDWPGGSVPPGSFGAIEEILPEDQNEVRQVLRPIEAGEPVLESKVSGFGGRATLSARISENMRAVTIRVNDVLGVGGFIMPGDRVDILLTREVGKTASRESKLITDILLQSVQVLGIDQEADSDTEKPHVARAVTVEVTPEQAQKLTLGSQVGSLSLALRNFASLDEAAQETVTIGDLSVGEVNLPQEPEHVHKVEAPAKKQVAKKVDTMTTVTIIRALDSSKEKVLTEKGEPAWLPPAEPGAPTNLLPEDLESPAAEVDAQASEPASQPSGWTSDKQEEWQEVEARVPESDTAESALAQDRPVIRSGVRGAWRRPPVAEPETSKTGQEG